MKKHLMILAAIATLVCGCNKLNDSVSALEKRIDDSEKTVQVLKDKVEAFEEILNKLQAQISITSVKAVDGGFEIAFSDGSTYKVVNGKDCEVSYDEDDLCYYFDFGDGEKLAVAKAGAFGIKVEKDEIELESGATVKVAYQLVGANETSKVIAEDSPYDVKITDKAIEISVAKAVSGNLVVKAVRNSDGATSAVVIKVSKKEITNVDIEITVSDISKFGAVASAVASTNEVGFMLDIQEAAYVNQFDTDEELFESDMEYWEEAYETKYYDYADTFEDFVKEYLLYFGSYTDDWDGYLKAGTDYIAYAYAVTDDLELLTKPIAKVAFTTEADEEVDATYLGVATWHDGFASYYFSLEADGYNLDLPVDVYEDNNTPGVFYFDSPYNYVNIAAWFDLTPEEMQQYTGNYRDAMIKIDASNPAAVTMEFQDLGVLMSGTYGWVSGGSQHPGMDDASTGVYADGQIKFEGDLYIEMSKYNPGDPDIDDEGTFCITMPEANGPTAMTAYKTMKNRGDNAKRSASKFVMTTPSTLSK